MGPAVRIRSARLTEREIDTVPAGQRVLAIGERADAVKEKTCWAAPNHDIRVFQRDPTWPVGATLAAEQKNCRQSQRYRDDWRIAA